MGECKIFAPETTSGSTSQKNWILPSISKQLNFRIKPMMIIKIKPHIELDTLSGRYNSKKK